MAELSVGRHSLSHIMAEAVLQMFPDAKLGIGPEIDDGFYYDFDLPVSLTRDHFPEIEQRMRSIMQQKAAMTKEVLPSKEAALERFQGQTYKEELIRDLPDDSEITLYQTGEGFFDLCRGPHVNTTAELLSWGFSIHSVAGAYWRGSEKNPMLQRLYAYAFPNKKELTEHIRAVEEAIKRDHRKVGRQLGLFMLTDDGPGFPFFLPKGTVLRNNLIRHWRRIHKRNGYQEIMSPILLKQNLWETSGHWAHYQNNIYSTQIDEELFCIKPMNCPGALLVYQSDLHSYRELPLRLAELGNVHRHEKSGALHGLMRVRNFTQDDAHVFMTEEQIFPEIKRVIAMIDELYAGFGMEYKAELSTMPEDHLGSEEDWDKATAKLRNALEESNLDYVVNEGDGAFYGPKIDFHLKDVLGRTWQCGTIQLDFQMPARFDIEYVGADGKRHRPVMIHHVVMGSVERFIGVLTEHFGGAFPFWLAPVQVGLVPVRVAHNDYGESVMKTLEAADIRCEILTEDEGMGGKIKKFRNDRVPYTLIMGDQEIESNTISIRTRNGKQIAQVTLDRFIDACKTMEAERSLALTEDL